MDNGVQLTTERRTLNYTLNKTTLKTLIKLPAWRNATHNYPVMGSVWVYLQSAHAYKIYICHLCCLQPICSSYHVYDYSYLMLTNCMGSNYMGIFSAIMLPMWSYKGCHKKMVPIFKLI